MNKITVFLITFSILWADGYTINATGNGGCPEGTNLIVSVPMQIKTDSKTGKTTFVAGEGRPVSQCVKDGIKKDTKPKKKKKQKAPPMRQFQRYGTNLCI